MKAAVFLFLGGLLSAVLAVLWWRRWMYHGLFGPPDFLAPMMERDGEGVYDRVQLEMFLVLVVPITTAIVIFLKRKV